MLRLVIIAAWLVVGYVRAAKLINSEVYKHVKGMSLLRDLWSRIEAILLCGGYFIATCVYYFKHKSEFK